MTVPVFMGDEAEPQRHQVTQLSTQCRWQGWAGEKALTHDLSALCLPQRMDHKTGRGAQWVKGVHLLRGGARTSPTVPEALLPGLLPDKRQDITPNFGLTTNNVSAYVWVFLIIFLFFPDNSGHPATAR